MFTHIHTLVSRIKTQQPLIINLSNFVTMDFIANGLLCLGAAPIMTEASQEMDDLLAIASSLVINIGTLTDPFIARCQAFADQANRLNIPIILDPVGAGASKYRTKTCLDLLEANQFAIIRGNASEINALAGVSQTTKGVESRAESTESIDSARYLSEQYNAVVAISGKTDVVVYGQEVHQSNTGSPMMPKITGSGCLLSSVVAAFAAVDTNFYQTTAASLVFYGICGELAEKSAKGPGSFRMHFLDALSYMPEADDYAQR